MAAFWMNACAPQILIAPAQVVSTFLRNHARETLACDFFVVVTATFRLVYVFLVLDIGSRRILHWNVTEHPTAEWTAQQFRGILTGDEPYRFVVHDRDAVFSPAVDDALKAMNLRVLKTPARLPQAKGTLPVREGADGVNLKVALVTGNLFSILGVTPLLGRNLQAQDDSIAAAPAVAISYELWQRRYGRDPSVLGRVLTIRGQPGTIVAVMPRGFAFPAQTDVGATARPFRPVAETGPPDFYVYLVGRLRTSRFPLQPGVLQKRDQNRARR